jgi:hypothetical protein
MRVYLANLKDADARTMVRLLGLLQDHLESAIESCLLPGATDPGEEHRLDVARDRRDWRAAETLVKKLTVPMEVKH